MFVWPIIALAGILLAVWFFGVRAPGSIGDHEAVLSHVRAAYPEFAPGPVAIDPDRRAALVAETSGNGLIVLFMMGNQVASRVVSAAAVRDIRLVEHGTGGLGVMVLLHDLGCPRIAMTLAACDAQVWSHRLAGLHPVKTHSLGAA